MSSASNLDISDMEISLENETMPHFPDIEDCSSNYEFVETDNETDDNDPQETPEEVIDVQNLRQQLEIERHNHLETARALKQLIEDHEELLLKHAAAENTIDSWRFQMMCLDNGTYEKPATVAISTSVEVREVVKHGSVYLTHPINLANYNQIDDEIHSCSHRSLSEEGEKAQDETIITFMGNGNGSHENRLTEEIFLKRAKQLEETIVRAAEDVTASSQNSSNRVERQLHKFKSRLESLKKDADELQLVYESPWDIVGKIATIEEAFGHLVEIVALVKSRRNASDEGQHPTISTALTPSSRRNSTNSSFNSVIQRANTVGRDAHLTESRRHSSASTIARETQDAGGQWDEATNEDSLLIPCYAPASVTYQRSHSHGSNSATRVTHSCKEAQITMRASKVTTLGSHPGQNVIQLQSLKHDNYKVEFSSRNDLSEGEGKKPRHEGGVMNLLNKLMRRSSRTEQRSEKLLRMF